MDDDEAADQQQEIIDEEELGYLQKMKELKRMYRDNYDQLKSVKGEVFFIQQSIDQQKQQLVAAFEEWYALTFETEEEALTQTVSLVH